MEIQQQRSSWPGSFGDLHESTPKCQEKLLPSCPVCGLHLLPPGLGRRMEHPWEIQHMLLIFLLLWREKEAQKIYGLPVLPAGL